MIDVCCAIIVNEQGDVLVARRSEKMSMPLKMEFPGGKMEKNESAEDCLIREIKEELNVTIHILSQQPSHIHHYPEFSIRLIPFVCKLLSGEMELKEHHSITWIAPENLMQCDWAAADIPVVEEYLNGL